MVWIISFQNFSSALLTFPLAFIMLWESENIWLAIHIDNFFLQYKDLQWWWQYKTIDASRANFHSITEVSTEYFNKYDKCFV